jgi:alkylation response protein AidB-like acyl-CoA dehydrogenase
MDFKLTEEQTQLRKQFFDVCEGLAKKRPEGFTGLEGCFDTDEGWRYHQSCAKEFASRNWLTLGWPKEYGGQGTIMDKVFLSEATGYHDVPGVDIFGVDMLAPTLHACASDEIKREFLPSIASGERMWCELWSEPNAGSDLASLATSAVRQGDEYVINGQKIWTTGAHRAHWAFALVRTDPQPERKQKGITFLLFDMNTPGITVRPLKYMDGSHLYNEVFLDDVRVPARNIVGQEHEGWAVTQTLANFERSSLGAIMSMHRQLEQLVEYCNEKKVGGEAPAKNPLIRSRLAQVAADLWAAHALAYRIVDAQANQGMAAFDASAVKVFSGELQARMARLGCDILGPYGQVKHSKWSSFEGFFEKWYQQSFILNVAMGTNEIQKNIIAWYGLGLPRMK